MVPPLPTFNLTLYLLYAAAETDIEQLRSIHEILEETNQ